MSSSEIYWRYTTEIFIIVRLRNLHISLSAGEMLVIAVQKEITFTPYDQKRQTVDLSSLIIILKIKNTYEWVRVK